MSTPPTPQARAPRVFPSNREWHAASRDHAVSGANGCVPESPDGAINHVFRCGLTLAAMMRRPDVTDEVAHRLGEAIDELDLAVSGIRRAAFTAFVADDDRHADTSEPDPTIVVASDPPVAEYHAPASARRCLRRIFDDGVFAYAMRGHDFYRASDHVLWAHESDDLLLSARSGTPFARRVADVFYDLETDVPLYYDDNHTRPLPVRSRGGSPAARTRQPVLEEADK
jgi:hypothetical protein